MDPAQKTPAKISSRLRISPKWPLHRPTESRSPSLADVILVMWPAESSLEKVISDDSVGIVYRNS
jgi:hypothetical protein